MVISGRSDAVLNPGGVRIGTAEIYRQASFLYDSFLLFRSMHDSRWSSHHRHVQLLWGLSCHLAGACVKTR